MVNFLFWNIDDKAIEDDIAELCRIHSINYLILGECNYDEKIILAALTKKTGFTYYYLPNILCEKIKIFTTFPTKSSILISDKLRYVAREIYSALYGNVTLIAIHYQSKVNWSTEDQAAHSVKIKEFIDHAEKEAKHKRTIVCGDMNMNPFEMGMVQTSGLHSVMEKNIARKGSRIVDTDEYHYFYNPMWGFLGDLGKGDVSGTMYFSPAKPVNFHWNLFDQVLIRPDLVDAFMDDKLDIITEIGNVSMLTRDGHVKISRFSDHLPVKFSLNI